MGLMTLGEGLLEGFEDVGDAVAYVGGAFGITPAVDWLKKEQSRDLIASAYNDIGATNTLRDTPIGTGLRWIGKGLSYTAMAVALGFAIAGSSAAAPVGAVTAGALGLASTIVAGVTGFGSSVEKNLNAGDDYLTAGIKGAGAAVRDAVITRFTMGLGLPRVGSFVLDAAMNSIPATATGSPSGQPSGSTTPSDTTSTEDGSSTSEDTDGDPYGPSSGTDDYDNGGGGGWDNSSDSGNYDDYTPTPDTGTTTATETELTSKEGLIPVQPTDEAKVEELKPTDNTEEPTTDQQNTNSENVITTEQSTNQPANTGENVTDIQDNPGETVVTETRYVQPEGNYQGYSYNENEGVSAPELETAPELDPNAIEDETELLTDIGELEDTTASFEDVIQANEYVKIPTSTTPIQTNPTSSGGNAFIPIAAGLSAAAAAGIGAKAYMDRKHNNDNGEEDDDFSEEWSDDYSDDNSITINENSADNQSESLLEDDYTYTEPEKYGARNNEELADLQ